MSQHWTIAGALLAFALLDAACADPEQDASSGAASGGSTSVSLHVVFLDGAYHEDGTELVWNELGHLRTGEVGQVLGHRR